MCLNGATKEEWDMLHSLHTHTRPTLGPLFFFLRARKLRPEAGSNSLEGDPLLGPLEPGLLPNVTEQILGLICDENFACSPAPKPTCSC